MRFPDIMSSQIPTRRRLVIAGPNDSKPKIWYANLKADIAESPFVAGALDSLKNCKYCQTNSSVNGFTSWFPFFASQRKNDSSEFARLIRVAGDFTPSTACSTPGAPATCICSVPSAMMCLPVLLAKRQWRKTIRSLLTAASYNCWRLVWKNPSSTHAMQLAKIGPGAEHEATPATTSATFWGSGWHPKLQNSSIWTAGTNDCGNGSSLKKSL